MAKEKANSPGDSGEMPHDDVSRSKKLGGFYATL